MEERIITNKEDEATITLGDNQVLTQQSAIDGEKISQEGKTQEMGYLQGGSSTEEQVTSAHTVHTIEKESTQLEQLIKENEQTTRSEEMDEELLDYDGDYELAEQEKAEMELYEKELADQEAREQRAQMEIL